jgi:hypothetical protein
MNSKTPQHNKKKVANCFCSIACHATVAEKHTQSIEVHHRQSHSVPTPVVETCPMGSAELYGFEKIISKTSQQVSHLATV